MTPISIKEMVNSFPSTASLFRKADFATALALVILSLVGVSAYKTRAKLSEYTNRTTHTNEIISEIRNMITDIQDAESGISNYLLSEDETFLEPYRKVVQTVTKRRERLNGLVGSHAEQSQKVAKLNSLVNEKLQQLFRIIQIGKEKGASDRNVQPQVVLGSMIMTDIRRLTNEIEMEQSGLLAEQAREADAISQKSYVTLGVSVLFVFVFLFSSRMIVLRQSRHRMEIENELKKTSLALENAVEGISRIDTEGNYVSVNKTYAALLGFPSEELIGKHWLTIVSADDRNRLLGAHQSMLMRGKAESEAVGICKNSSTKYLKITMVQNKEDGIFSGHHCFISDISVQKKENQELINARKAALEASVAKSEFLANMSHEIRTPMNGVIGMTGLLASTQLTEKQKQYVDTVKVSAEALLSLINDILDLSKIESRKMTFESIDFDLEEVVNDSKKIVDHAAANKGIGLHVDIAPSVPRILKGDPGKLRQILVNLFGNAVKFTSEGAVTTFITMLSDDESTVELRVEVHDTGIGIPPEKQEKLFQSFSQADSSTSRQYGGTGLGLAICKRLVDMMSGDIGVQSEAGKGSTFWFNIRLERGNPANIQKTDNSQHNFTIFNRPDIHVLIVEDNLVNQKVALEMLAKLGLSADTADNGVAAVEAYKNKKYDLILMDCHLPGMDGYQATREIRKLEIDTSTRIPIVALTADVTSGDRQTAFDAGMDDYATKPVEFAILAKTLKKWLWKDSDLETLIQDDGTEVIGSESTYEFDDSKLVPVVDWVVLEKLRNFQRPGGGNLMLEMVELYKETAPNAILKIRDAAKSHDWPSVVSEAHSVKSGSAQIGLMLMSDLCKRIEFLGKLNSDGEELRNLIGRLIDEYNHSQKELDKGLKAQLPQSA